MHNINLICTTHESCGNCNPDELCRIIESIRPDIIFEELSQANFDSAYKDWSLINPETTAINMYLLTQDIEHRPVDTYRASRSDEEKISAMLRELYDNPMLPECRSLRSLVDQLMSLKSKYGFGFLNSDQNDELIEKMNVLEEAILDIMNDENLFSINRMRKEVIERREEEILNNIYYYSKEHTYNQAILFIGSGHRRAIIEKIKKYEMTEETKLNWIIYGV